MIRRSIRTNTRRRRKRIRSCNKGKRMMRRSRKATRVRSRRPKRRKNKNPRRLHRLMMKTRKRLKACKPSWKSPKRIALANRHQIQPLNRWPCLAQFWKSLEQCMLDAFRKSTRIFLQSTSTRPTGRKINHLISIWPAPERRFQKCSQERFCGSIAGLRRAGRMTGITAERFCMTLSCLSGNEIRSFGIRRVMCSMVRTMS